RGRGGRDRRAVRRADHADPHADAGGAGERMMASLLVAGLALALVLVGVGLVFRAVNRIAFGGRYGAGRSALSVVARVAIGPRQGLAVVRVGDRGVVVSMGE